MTYIPRNQAVRFLADTNGEADEAYDAMTNDQLHVALYLSGIFDDDCVTITGYEGGM